MRSGATWRSTVSVLLILLASLCISKVEVYEARVIDVVDGDTFKVIIDGRVERVRVLGIDCPELKPSKNDPAEFGGVPTAILTAFAKEAKIYAEQRLLGKNVTLEIDPAAGKRDRYGRILAYVYVDGEDFGERLLELGLARVYESEFAKKQKYVAIQREAMKKGVGIWGALE